MISIGCTSWGDHHSLYRGVAARDKLKAYSEHFPIVEVDTSFYAIPPRKNCEKWVQETPETFGFIVKAYKGMTGHERVDSYFTNEKEMFAAFAHSLEPLVASGKLRAVLCQFPPWFDCRREHVEKLKRLREWLEAFPCALELRHQSWFYREFRERTLDFMTKHEWIHTVCDEPQAGEGSVPAVLEATDKRRTYVRLHGRNKDGWNFTGDGEEWRKVRHLYRYSEEELREWARSLKRLSQMSEQVDVVFNNNSGGDAADNAKQLISLLGIRYEGLAPKQLRLF
ncbi:MAG TPA: DUF72 domain-containing protein [Bacillales bacterium]|nr:DUF72 domain-containing protein [Bacillales bacterium]